MVDTCPAQVYGIVWKYIIVPKPNDRSVASHYSVCPSFNGWNVYNVHDHWIYFIKPHYFQWLWTLLTNATWPPLTLAAPRERPQGTGISKVFCQLKPLVDGKAYFYACYFSHSTAVQHQQSWRSWRMLAIFHWNKRDNIKVNYFTLIYHNIVKLIIVGSTINC